MSQPYTRRGKSPKTADSDWRMRVSPVPSTNEETTLLAPVSEKLKGAGFPKLEDLTCMTQLDVAFRYGAPPGENELHALTYARDVYGVRKIEFDEAQQIIRVEYDATRLNDDMIAGILRQAGLDLREKVDLV